MATPPGLSKHTNRCRATTLHSALEMCMLTAKKSSNSHSSYGGTVKREGVEPMAFYHSNHILEILQKLFLRVVLLTN